MRLAIVCEQASPRGLAGQACGGSHAGQLAELATVLWHAGHDVRLYTRADGSGTHQLADGVPVEHIRAGPTGTVADDARLPHTSAFGQRLVSRWRRRGWEPDLVHAHDWLSGLAATTAGQQAGVPVALTFHEVGMARRRHLGAADPSPSCRVGMERKLAQAVDRVITQTRAGLDELVRLGVARQRMSLIPAGVDPRIFTPRPSAPRGGRRILTVGSLDGLDEHKGLSDVIRALAQLPGAELAIVGGPPGSAVADPRARRLQELAEACGVGPRMRLVDGVRREQMPDWYRWADLVVCAPWYEAFGLPAVEAMACGVPVVATAVGGLRDTVVDRVTGALVPPRDPAALARAVRGVLGDSVRRLGYSAAARDRVRQCYAWERVAPRLEMEYRQLCPSALTRTASA